MSESEDPPAGMPPCPGCGMVGAPSETWAGEDKTQLWECVEDDCRTWTYLRREKDPQQDIDGGYSE